MGFFLNIYHYLKFAENRKSEFSPFSLNIRYNDFLWNLFFFTWNLICFLSVKIEFSKIFEDLLTMMWFTKMTHSNEQKNLKWTLKT